VGKGQAGHPPGQLPLLQQGMSLGGGFILSPPFSSSISHILQIHDISYLKEQETGYKWQNAILSGQIVHGDTPLPSFGAARYVFANVHAIFCSFNSQDVWETYFIFCIMLNGAPIPYLVLLGYPTYPT
jgi:hypothetical protein